MDVGLDPTMVTSMAAALREAPPERDVDFFGHEKFLSCFVRQRQLNSQLYVMTVPYFELFCKLGYALLVLDHVGLLIALFKYNDKLLGDTSLFLYVICKQRMSGNGACCWQDANTAIRDSNLPLIPYQSAS